MFLGGLPFGLLNLYWNLNACWCNVMFNAINRHEGDGSGWSAATPLLYAASLAYLAAPLLWFAWRGRARLREAWRRPGERALLLAWLVPLAVFAALSPVKRIGLHWLLSFVPALVLSVALALERRQLALSVRFFAAAALLQAVPIAIVAALPLETWQAARFSQRLVFPGRIAELLAAVAPDLPGAAARRGQLRLGRAARLSRAAPGAGVRQGDLARAAGRHRHRLARLRRQGPACAAGASCPRRRTTSHISARSR